MTPVRRTLTGVALAGVLLTPGPAMGTDGGLYPSGASIWAVGPQFTATVLAGPVWQIQAPALAPASVGNQWEMNWGCPVGGSEIAAVQWGALRTQAPSSLAFQVTGDRRTIWSEGDAAAPQSPEPGRAYDVRLPGGNCNVHLALTQTEARNQHARGYFIDNPRVLVRDLTPPSVTLRGLSAGWLTASSTLRVDWTASDNFGADGMGQQRIVVAGQTRWTGVPGEGDHGVGIGLAGIGDGIHGVDVQVDGDGTGGAGAGGTISVDSTPPTAGGLVASASGTPGATSLAWRADDNLSGVATSRAEINTASDGSTSGSWDVLGTTRGSGQKALTVARVAVGDGTHAWRLRTTDEAGNATDASAAGRIVVDTTPPRVDVHSVPGGWVNRAEIDLTASDNLQSTLGLGSTEIDVNAASDGSDSGEWLSRASGLAPAGRRIVPLDLSGLENGRHVIRIIVHNGGPLGGALATEKRATLRLDLTDPTISRATFSPGGAHPATVSWVAEDLHSGVATATVQWRDGATWRTLETEKAGEGGGSMVVDASALPDGDRAVRIQIADAAGNVASRAGTMTISGGGGGSIAGDPSGRLSDAHLTVTIDHARPEHRGSRPALVRTVVAGARVRHAGRLLDRDGLGIVGAQVQVRDQRGLLIGHGLTRSGGRFVIEARPIGGGPVRVGVAAGSRLLPRRAAVDLRIEVRPQLTLSASATGVSPGDEVLFSGRLRPSPADLGIGSRKGIVLEWRDPVRGIWRPVVNARINGDGTFAIPWTFGLGGLTIPMRVVVPGEVGWPLLPVHSGVIRVRVN